MKDSLRKEDTASVVRLCKVEQSVRTELGKPYVFIVTKKRPFSNSIPKYQNIFFDLGIVCRNHYHLSDCQPLRGSVLLMRFPKEELPHKSQSLIIYRR